MNKTIELLKTNLEELNKNKNTLEYEIKSIENILHKATYDETRILNEVLKNNLIDIIELIHKGGLKCSSVYNGETIWNDTVYKISDGCYFINIVAKDGTIKLDYTNIDNDGGGKKLHEKAKELLSIHIIPYCEKNKDKYKK